MRPSEFCLQFVGQKELPGNVFNNDTLIGKLLDAAGQQDGQAYCSYTQEAIFKACNPSIEQELDKLFDASATKTFKNFRDASYLIGNLPQIDSLVIWQLYVNNIAQWQGHAGLSLSSSLQFARDKYFRCFEGNTGGDAREGDGFYIKKRTLEPIKLSGVGRELRIMGFIQIPS